MGTLLTVTVTDRRTGEKGTGTGTFSVRQPLQPVPGTALWGAYPGGNNALPAEFVDTVSKRPLTPVTRYNAMDDETPSAADLALSAQGQLFRIAWSSRLKAGGAALWGDVAAGKYDAAIAAHAKLYAQLGPCWANFETEPDGMVDIGRSGPIGNYAPAFERLYSIAAPLMPQAVWGICWTGDLANESKMLTSWTPAVPVKWVLADLYDATLSKGSPLKAWQPWADWTGEQKFSEGLATGLGETGVQPSATTGDARDQAGAAWIAQMPAAAKELGFSMVEWFNSSGGLGNTALVPGSLMAQAYAGAGAQPFFTPA